jgi:hypothetical protein
MNEMNELIAVAKKAANPEELLALAKEEGLEITSEAAADYFTKLHPEDGELSDDELDNVSGGGCLDDNTPSGKKVKANGLCDWFQCACNQGSASYTTNKDGPVKRYCAYCSRELKCQNCRRAQKYSGNYYCTR